MSKLQAEILAEFKTTYPELSLTEISKLTGIQITRTFRILNGSEMKLKEYEAFKASLNHTQSYNKFLSIADQCSKQLTQNKLKELIFKMSYELKKSSVISSSYSTLDVYSA